MIVEMKMRSTVHLGITNRRDLIAICGLSVSQHGYSPISQCLSFWGLHTQWKMNFILGFCSFSVALDYHMSRCGRERKWLSDTIDIHLILGVGGVGGSNTDLYLHPSAPTRPGKIPFGSGNPCFIHYPILVCLNLMTTKLLLDLKIMNNEGFQTLGIRIITPQKSEGCVFFMAATVGGPCFFVNRRENLDVPPGWNPFSWMFATSANWKRVLEGSFRIFRVFLVFIWSFEQWTKTFVFFLRVYNRWWQTTQLRAEC